MATVNPSANSSQRAPVVNNETEKEDSVNISRNFDGQQDAKSLRKSRSNDRKFSLDGYDEKGVVEDDLEGEELLDESPGTLPDSVYDLQMSWWRAAVRRMLIKSLVHESRILGAIQRKVRNNPMDTYFLYSSALGSHTFFMSALPALFYFGHGEVGRGLLQIMCIGVYVSSFMKDCFCSPRPFVPQVTRLSIGTHHLEYGFPSTHSTNCMSFTVYLFLLLREDALNPDSLFASPVAYWTAISVIVWYAASIVLGRLYCGMHSFTDCIAGSLLGATIGIIQGVYGPLIEETVANANWTLPVTATLLCLLLTNQHPQPVDDCPCFEDAIASLALLTGTVMSRWHASQVGSMNLPAELSQRTGFGEFGHDENAHTTGRLPHAHIHNGAEMHMKWRGSASSSGVGVGHVPTRAYVDSKGEKIDEYDDLDGQDINHERIKHYDADVLTKVIVYSGIGAIATYLTPVTFEILQWGVQPVV
ncbi:hypothetical protein FRB91_007354 [Serendipita sp. 411]|nr:hypothetical protein FRB91_007354 [Serendipita sp. 411]